jgi:glycosyltransferase involved in cell wall biosynthesis
MKIAYDPQIFCAQIYGGVSRYFCELASRLAQQPDMDISIAAPFYVNRYVKIIPSGVVKGFACPKKNGFKSLYPRLIHRLLSLLLGDFILRSQFPDVVHETYFSPFPIGPRRARRVLTIYDMIHEKFPGDFPETDNTSKYKALAARRADHVICISESTRRDVIEILGIPPEKTSVIYLGFELLKDHNHFEYEDSFQVDGAYLLFVGLRGGYKNFLRLLEAHATSSYLRANFKLVCFGGGPFNSKELGRISELGLNTNQVIQLGGSDMQLSQLYSKATAFIYPSLYEGFGIPPLEAMSHDCPVICGHNSSIPEVVGDAGVYFESTNLGSIRETIERTVQSEPQRKILIEKGRERLTHFSWDRCANETRAVYENLL